MHGELQEIVPLNSRQFAIAARRLADSLAYGTDKSPFLGSGQAGKGNAGAWQSDARSGAWVDLQSTAGEQSAALYQLLDEVFAGLFE